MFNKDFILTQSALKAFEDQSVCLEDFKRRFVTKESPFESTLKMDYGSYFEYLCIGKSAGYNDQITDLPRKRNGEMTVAQERIIKQSELFSKLFDIHSDKYCWLEIKGIQKKLLFENQSGILDIEAEDSFDKSKYIIDLKMTSDVSSTRHPMMFGHDENIDITQAVHYAWLWEKIYGVRPIFSYFVFDYKKNLEFKRIDVEVSDDDILDLNDRKNALFNFVYNHDPSEDWSKYSKI